MLPSPFYESATYLSEPGRMTINFVTTDSSLQGYADEGWCTFQTAGPFLTGSANLSLKQGTKDTFGRWHNKFSYGVGVDNDVQIATVGTGNSTPAIYAYPVNTTHAQRTGNSIYPRILFMIPPNLAPVPLDRSNTSYKFAKQIDLRSLARSGYLGYTDHEGVYHMLLSMTVNSTYGGRSSTDKDVQRILMSSTLAIGNAAYQALADAFVAQFKTILIVPKQISYVVISPINSDGSTKLEKNNYMRFNYAVAGTRAIAGGVDPTYDKIVAAFSKNASFGGSGGLYVRGSYTEAEIAAGADRYPATVSGFVNTVFTSFAANLPGIFTTNSCQMILPGNNKSDILEGARNVTSMTYLGPRWRKDTRTTISLSQAEKNLIRRQVNAAEEEYAQAVRDNGGTNTEVIVNFFIGLIRELINQYGVSLILKFITYPVLRAAVRALPALGA